MIPSPVALLAWRGPAGKRRSSAFSAALLAATSARRHPTLARANTMANDKAMEFTLNETRMPQSSFKKDLGRQTPATRMKPPAWLVLTLSAIVLWGLYGIALRLAADRISPLAAQVLSSAGLIAPALFLIPHVKRERGDRRGFQLAFISGLFGAVGSLALIFALSRGGKTAIVFPLTSLYPLVTVLAAFLILKEVARAVQWIGIAFALAAVVVLSVEPGSSLAAFRFGDWLLWALGALVSFGLVAICQKLATNRISAESTFAMFAAGFIPVAIIAALMERWPRGLPTRPVIWAILGGLLNGLGVLATIAAYRKGGKVSIVTPLAALSAAVTVLLAVLWLREPVTEIQSVGIGLALLAGFCLARE